MFTINTVIAVVLYIVLAPVAGCLLAGVDRKISARMQGRFGPPLLQPYYDVRKLLEKDPITVNKVQDFYIGTFLLFVIITGCIFFAGGDYLLVIFSLTLASVLMVVAAYCSNSVYSQVGAERELLQMMAYEPMVLFMVIGFYLVYGSFNISDIVIGPGPAIIYLPGIFVGFLFILTMKLRKSPFDLSMSHHAHQEVVKGITTEWSGKTLALVEIAHWYENILFLGFIYIFFAWDYAFSPMIAIIVCLAAYFLEIFIDNNYARMKWQFAINSCWIVAIVFGFVNLLVLYFMKMM